jgi:hypothetical protein
MNRWIVATRYVVLGLFLVTSAGIAAYDWWFVWPAQKCDRAGAWWDPRDHQCLDPVPIWRMTGREPATLRPAAVKPAAAAAKP